MIIVIEGVDNSGKSTLAAHIARAIDWPIQPSEGPPKGPGEMNERLARYDNLDNYIFDRHPVISQTIYGAMREFRDTFNPWWTNRLKAANPLYIYCDPQGRGLTGHVEKRDTVDSQVHLKQIYDKYFMLLVAYREWAIANAHIMYRIGDDMDRIVYFVKAWRQHNV